MGEIIGFFRNFFAKNGNKEKLFKLEKQSGKKNILIVSKTALPMQINFEALAAKYFNLQGYNVYFLTDLKERSAVKIFRSIQGRVLYHNFIYLKKALTFLFRDLPMVKTNEELRNFSYQGVNLGIGVYASVSRVLKVGRLDFSHRKTGSLIRKFLWRSMVFLETSNEILKKIKPDLILANEKGYVSFREIFNLAVENGIDFIQWVGCQESNALALKRYNKDNRGEHPFSLSQETWCEFIKKPFDKKWEIEVFSSFERGYLSQDWFSYKRIAKNVNLINKEKFVKGYDLSPDKKVAVLFSHIMWDANLFYGEDLFEGGFEEWLVESVRAMKENKNINWLIKIHPANKFKHELENIKDEYREIKAIKENFGEIPENIKIIYPEDNINPYALFKIIDYGITVRGTIGIELPCFGIPVITAGTGRYSGRGFTIDPKSKEEYLQILSQLENLPRLNKKARELALLHAFILFKLRPLKFTSYKEKRLSDPMRDDIEILINRPEQGRDFIKFIDWAVNSRKEDFLTNN